MLDAKAYTEVFFILNEMSEELRKKIPKQVIKSIEEKMDKNYEFYVEDIENVELLEDTEKILSVLYTDYLATEEEKLVILNKESTTKQSSLKKVKINTIFKESKYEEKKELIKNEKWYKKLFENIKIFFYKLLK